MFDLGERFGAATFGWAFLEGNTIAGVMDEFEAQVKLPKTVGEAAEQLRDYFLKRMRAHLDAGYDDEPPEGHDVLGFIVGGYDKEGIGRLKLVYLPSGEIADGSATSAGETGVHWQGEPDVFVRLLKGYDALRLDTSSWSDEQRAQLEQLEYLAPVYRMTLQDAVDFAAFVIRTTVDMQRFSDGTVGDPRGFPTCGGEPEILVVTSRGLSWVQRRGLQRASAPGHAEGARD